MKFNECNQNQKRAWMQVVYATQWIVGGLENEIADGWRKEMIPHDELAKEIYEVVMTCTTYEGFQSFRPIKEIRFVGADWIKERIEKRLIKLGY